VLSVKVSAKNQIAVPSEARRRLGIAPGDRLTVEITDEAMVLRVRPAKPSDRLRGLARGLWQGKDAVDYVRDLRDEFDAK
jgi:AbrB family looped-hinge helix DNA binding protein